MKILHDIHTHNMFSNCCSDHTATVPAYFESAKKNGLRTFGLSNHIWDSRVPGASGWYRTQHVEHSAEARYAFDRAPEGLRVLFGAETEYFACKDILGMSVEGAAVFDYMLVPHSHNHMRNNVMADYPEIIEARREIKAKLREFFPELSEAQCSRMGDCLNERDLMPLVPELKTNVIEFTNNTMLASFEALMENPEFIKLAHTLPTSVAHPFSPCNVPHEEKNKYLAELPSEKLMPLFKKAAALGVSMEINTSAAYEVTPDLEHSEYMRVLRCAKDAGCTFTFGTDSHDVKTLDTIIERGEAISNYLELTPANIAEYLRDSVEE